MAHEATATTSEPSTGALRVCSGCSKNWSADGSRYRYVILHTWESSLIRTLKAKNPGIKVLVYKDTEATVAYSCHNGIDDQYLPAGVGYCWANVNHPGWFLKGTSGSRIQFADFPGDWLMDVGNPAYQTQWTKNVIGDAKALGFDGVYLDDVNDGGEIHWHAGSKTIAKYPTSASWTQATTSFMAAVGLQLKAAGLLVLPNIAISDWWTSKGLSTWDTWVSYSSGGVQQYYTKWGRDSSHWLSDDGGWHNNWSYRQAFLRHTQSAGKIFIGSTFAPADDAHSMRYARASFLVDWNGGRSALIFEPTDPEAQDPYSRVWTEDIGTPAGSRFKVGVAWRRNYTAGTAIVNPSPATSQTVALGADYVTLTGSVVSSVTVRPTDGIILKLAPTSLPSLSGGGSSHGGVDRVRATATPRSHCTSARRCSSHRSNCAIVAAAERAMRIVHHGRRGLSAAHVRMHVGGAASGFLAGWRAPRR
jgi:hypothetical protein